MLSPIKERNAVVIEVLKAGKLEHLWTTTGPTLEAVRVRDEAGQGVTPEVHVWVCLAFELFNGTGGLTISRMFDVLTSPDLVSAFSFCCRAAMGTHGLESILDSGGSDPEGGATLN